MKTCPNCQQAVLPKARFCAHCGLHLDATPKVPPLEGRAFTGMAWLDMLLGFLLVPGLPYLTWQLTRMLSLAYPLSGQIATYSGHFASVLYLIGVIIARASLKKSYPAFAQGLLIGLVALVVLIVVSIILVAFIVLGILALCKPR